LTLHFRVDWKGLLLALLHLVTKATAVISVRVKPEGKDSWCTIREISYLL